MKGRKLLSIKEILIVLLVFCFVLQDLIQTYVPFFQYYDETVSVLFFVLYLFIVLKEKRIEKNNFILLGLAMLVMIIGLLSNNMSGINRSYTAIATDIGNTFKFLFIFLGMIEISPKLSNGKIVCITAMFVKVYLIILAVCAVLNLVMDIGMASEIRYGIRSFCFVYGISGVVINHCTYILVVLMAERSIRRLKNTLFIVIDLFVILCTLKSRGMGLCALFLMLFYLFFIMKKVSVKKYIGIIIVILGTIGASQLDLYFNNNETAPRFLFLVNSIKLARDYFPWGTGFATFGSHAAAHYYSPLYYTLGFSSKYGMGEKGSMFLNDNYWPTILGQFGILGLMVFSFLLFKYFRKLYTLLVVNKNKESKLIFWFVTMDVLMSSIQSSYISHYSMIALIFITMICFNNRLHYEEEGISVIHI